MRMFASISALLAACAAAVLWLATPATEHAVDCKLDMTYFAHGKPMGWVRCTGVLKASEIALPEPTDVGTRLECIRVARYVPRTRIKIPFTPSEVKDCKPKQEQ
jgi:hypothetical protein